jgi:hypothetical protein
MELYALSIAGPFGYWLLSQQTIEPYGQKTVELRSWKPPRLGIMVAIHCSQNKEFDHNFKRLGIDPALVPKSSILGVAVLNEYRVYDTEEQWERDRHSYCWVGDEAYNYIRSEYYGGPPIGHVFSEFMLFPEPILNVPGDRQYWRPNPKKPKLLERQEAGFKATKATIAAMRSET